MIKELEYTKKADTEHIKSFGQYFTQYSVAKFMCSWACKNANSMLDPAAGNSIFLKQTQEINPACKLFGFEIDSNILSFFGNPSNAILRNEDYLLNDWDNKYDAIVCNPPYNRFQSVSNRDEIIKTIYDHTGIKYSGYTNLYILFLIKSLYQLSSNGQLAYIIPTEFLNSQYGTIIKEKLLKEKLLTAIINFQNDDELFFNATTTCCILLVDHTPKKSVMFFNLSSIKELENISFDESQNGAISIEYSKLNPADKWRRYLNQEKQLHYNNLVDISNFCKVSRGIATGSNEFFCLNKSKMSNNNIPIEATVKCICRSADVKAPIFKESDFDLLKESDKTVFLLDIKKENESSLQDYISMGEFKGINKKYLLSRRKPWYSMEQKPIAPIWVSSANRDGIKFVRNLANVNSLTTFHSVFINEAYLDITDIIFCYFLTPIAQNIIRENRKELGNGLEKFQPNDLKTAKMLNLTILSEIDRRAILDIYEKMCKTFHPSYIDSLNQIFSIYLID